MTWAAGGARLFGDFTGQSVAVSGAAGGIGYAVAAGFARRGASVLLGDVDAARVGAAARQIGLGVRSQVLDVRSVDSFDAFLNAAEAGHGPLDIMVNNAGVDWMGPFDAQPLSAMTREVEVNLLGVIHGSLLAMQRMLPRGRGHLVNVASAAGRIPQPGSAVYTATKYGVVGLTEALRLEYRGRGVDFTLVHPGQTRTAIMSGAHTSSRLPMLDPEQVAAEVLVGVAAKRFEVWAPRSLAHSVRMAALVPRALRDWGLRTAGVHDIVDKLDTSARADYLAATFAGAGAAHEDSLTNSSEGSP